MTISNVGSIGSGRKAEHCIYPPNVPSAITLIGLHAIKDSNPDRRRARVLTRALDNGLSLKVSEIEI